MMDELIQRAESLRAGLQSMLRDTLDIGQVQGATLEVDSYWMEWELSRRTKIINLKYGAEDELPNYVSPTSNDWDYFKWDFESRPDDWPSYCRVMGYGDVIDPRIIRIILRKPLAIKPHGNDKPIFLPRSYEGHRILFEVRPPAVATTFVSRFAQIVGSFRSQGQPRAISVGRNNPKTSGTLGGFLCYPPTGQLFLISCAHVLGTAGPDVFVPGPYESRAAVRVGKVRVADIPPSNVAGQNCNFVGTPNAGRVDLAVAEWLPDSKAVQRIAPIPTANRIRLTGKMVPYQPVTFVGKESKRVRAQLGAVTIWHEVQFKDFGDGPAGSRCFGTLFELTDRTGDRRDVAKDGDSGAWIFDDVGDRPSWNGMLIARQGRRAYGCYAEYVMEVLNNLTDFPGGFELSW